VLQPQTVLRVAEVRHLAVPHRRRREEAGTELMLLPVTVALLFRVFRGVCARERETGRRQRFIRR
jgi:hypothetical protein